MYQLQKGIGHNFVNMDALAIEALLKDISSARCT